MAQVPTHAATPFPRIPLLGAGLLLSVTMAIVLVSRLADVSTVTPVDVGNLVESRVIVFEDGDKGALVVKDAATGETIYTTTTGVDGFLRGTLRALGRNRKREGGSRAEPFTVSRFESGHIVLTDSVTGAKIDLAAFGSTNEAVFERFLKSKQKEATP
jgi:putative photosynthetic complex assembly protein